MVKWTLVVGFEEMASLRCLWCVVSYLKFRFRSKQLKVLCCRVWCWLRTRQCFHYTLQIIYTAWLQNRADGFCKHTQPWKTITYTKIIHNCCFLGLVCFFFFLTKKDWIHVDFKIFQCALLTNYKMETWYVLLDFRAKSECLSIFQKRYWWIPTTFKLCKCFITWRIVCMYIHTCIDVHICTHFCMHVAVFSWRWIAPGLNNSCVLLFPRAHVYREMNEMHF